MSAYHRERVWRVAYLRPGAYCERRDDHRTEAQAEMHAATLRAEGLRAEVYPVWVERETA